MAKSDSWAGIALSEDIEAAIEDGLRVFPDGVEAADIIYALIRNLANFSSKHGLTVSQIGNAWSQYNRGKLN